MSRARELLAALMNAEAGGFVAHPPGLDGEPGLGIAAVSGVPRPRTWDVVTSAHAPALPGETAAFVVLGDGTIVVDDDVPEDSLVPLGKAVEKTLEPPYRAAALRHEHDVWSVVAEKVEIVEIHGLDGNVVDLSIVDRERELRVDGVRTIRPIHALDALALGYEDVALHAERVDDDLFAVDVFAL